VLVVDGGATLVGPARESQSPPNFQ
jgi:hypothetical protein